MKINFSQVYLTTLKLSGNKTINDKLRAKTSNPKFITKNTSLAPWKLFAIDKITKIKAVATAAKEAILRIKIEFLNKDFLK